MFLEKNLKKSLVFVLAIFLAFFVLCPSVLAITPMNGLNQTAGKAYNDNDDGDVAEIIDNVPSVIGKLVGAVLALLGVIFFILMIYGGFLWMFSRGNEQDVAKAKDLIQSAIIGLIIVLAAYAITAYIGTELATGKEQG